MWDRTLEYYKLLNHIVSRCWVDWPRCEVVCRVPAFIAMSSCFQIVSLSPGVTHTLHMITVQWCWCVCVQFEFSTFPPALSASKPRWKFPCLQFTSLPLLLSLPAPQSQMWMVDSPGRPYSVPGSSFSVSRGLIDCSLHNGYNTCPRDRLASSGKESALNRNIAAILISFHCLLIILLARPIQEPPDKSAAQWAARWRATSGVWMALARVMFRRASALFSVV